MAQQLHPIFLLAVLGTQRGFALGGESFHPSCNLAQSRVVFGRLEWRSFKSLVAIANCPGLLQQLKWLEVSRLSEGEEQFKAA